MCCVCVGPVERWCVPWRRHNVPLQWSLLLWHVEQWRTYWCVGSKLLFQASVVCVVCVCCVCVYICMYIGGAVALGMAGGAGREVVVVQGDTFDINFECVDSNGSLTTLGIIYTQIQYTVQYMLASYTMVLLWCACVESGRSFKVSAAIQKKANSRSSVNSGKTSLQQDTESEDIHTPLWAHTHTHTLTPYLHTVGMMSCHMSSFSYLSLPTPVETPPTQPHPTTPPQNPLSPCN